MVESFIQMLLVAMGAIEPIESMRHLWVITITFSDYNKRTGEWTKYRYRFTGNYINDIARCVDDKEQNPCIALEGINFQPDHRIAGYEGDVVR